MNKWFRNRPVSMKLIIAFGLFIAGSIIIGVLAITQINTLSAKDSALYERHTVPMAELVRLQNSYGECTSRVTDAVLQPAIVEQVIAEERAVQKSMTDSLTAMRAQMDEDNAAEIAKVLQPVVEKQFTAIFELLDGVKQGKTVSTDPDLRATMMRVSEQTDQITASIETLAGMLERDAGQSADAVNQVTANALLVILIMLGAFVLIGIFLALYVTSCIAKPLRAVVAVANEIVNTGNLAAGAGSGDKMLYEAKDEIGQTVASFTQIMKLVIGNASVVERISSGDISMDVNVISERDTMGNSISTMVGSLNEVIGNINQVSTQVSAGARQIADGGQALAQGTTEQASAIQQLSASITQVAAQTRANADNAETANQLANKVKTAAETGEKQMEHMVHAVEEISAASGSIAKIIETIKDIAFQTNILALNASIEAASAGQHGRGFAVVAEEVKNLSTKTTEAAKETSEMISNSIIRAKEGVEIANETYQSLENIVSGIDEAAQLIAQIARASNEQALAIGQIDKGIEQVSLVVQNNSATAEESASASHEISSQADVMNDLVGQFKLRQDNRLSAGKATRALPSGGYVAPRAPAHAPHAPGKQQSAQAPASPGGFGKY